MKLLRKQKMLLSAVLFISLAVTVPFIVDRGFTWLGEKLNLYIEHEEAEDKRALMRHWNNGEKLSPDVRRRLEAMDVKVYPIAGAGADTR